MMPARRTASGDGGSSAAGRHIPVLLDAVIAALGIRDGHQFIDGTFGAGGYTGAILAAADARVLAIDRDPEAIASGGTLMAASGGRLTLAEGRFGDLDQIAAEHNFTPADGVVLDIGVSSMQLDQAERGFSFQTDGPLDMRMEQAGPSAADLVRDIAEGELADLIYLLGEERQSRRIARTIVAARQTQPITTTGALARVVESAIGRKPGDERHPATRTFQALRIAINDELGELVRGLHAAERILAPGGRLAVVTFHSLEDRIVKRFLARRGGRAADGSRHLPPTLTPPASPSFHLVNHKPVTADAAELAANPRARSAKLRVAERTKAAAWADDDAAELGLPVWSGREGRRR